MMVRLTRVLEHPGSYSRMYVEAVALVLISELMDGQPGSAFHREGSRFAACHLGHQKGGLAGWQRHAVCEYIEEHLPEEISLAELASIARLSPSHFCRAFKETVGQPPHQYQISRRIERAKALLANPGLSVSDVATAVGYNSESRFSAIFKRVTGRPPGRFRRN
jgi:AraC family transcriptional regulator